MIFIKIIFSLKTYIFHFSIIAQRWPEIFKPIDAFFIFSSSGVYRVDIPFGCGNGHLQFADPTRIPAKIVIHRQRGAAKIIAIAKFHAQFRTRLGRRLFRMDINHAADGIGAIFCRRSAAYDFHMINIFRAHTQQRIPSASVF